MFQPRAWLLLGIIAFSAGFRLIPYVFQYFGADLNPSSIWYPWSFSPVSAMFLFGGAHVANRKVAIFLPLAALLLSDVLIGVLMGNIWFGLHEFLPAVYVCYALMACGGIWLRRRLSVANVALAAILAEVVFFFVTNFAQWALGDTYPHDAAGLWLCFVMALPFVKNAFLSTALYTTVFFGGWALLDRKDSVGEAAGAMIPGTE